MTPRSKGLGFNMFCSFGIGGHQPKVPLPLGDRGFIPCISRDLILPDGLVFNKVRFVPKQTLKPDGFHHRLGPLVAVKDKDRIHVACFPVPCVFDGGT